WITQDPSTLEYILAKPKSLCDSCIHKVLENEFSIRTNGKLANLLDLFKKHNFHRFISSAPHNFLSKIKFASKGGFMRIKEFSVIDGNKYDIILGLNHVLLLLKQLEDGNGTVHLFIKEIHAQFNLYGVTKDPSTSQYMFVIHYALQGGLRRFLQKNFDQLTLENKLNIDNLYKIPLFQILDYADRQMKRRCLKKIYGVIPNVTPEILRFKSPYYQAGDIYNLAFANRAHYVNLITDVCDGLRPKKLKFSASSGCLEELTLDGHESKYYKSNQAYVVIVFQIKCKN
ncbi:32672_t:CDS:2, partial [Gigaspora margarita]